MKEPLHKLGKMVPIGMLDFDKETEEWSQSRTDKFCEICGWISWSKRPCVQIRYEKDTESNSY